MQTLRTLYDEIDPYDIGHLQVSDVHHLYYEQSGNPNGRPAVFLHGGPGAGLIPEYRRFFDPEAYRVILFEQRGSGRSLPHASLEDNTTWHLVADIEKLRNHFGVEQWLVFGGSWGSTLGLAYAETHPDRVTEMVLAGVTTGRKSEFDWLFRGGIALLFPEQWERLVAALPPSEREGDIVDAYRRLFDDEDPDVRRRAVEAWCLWESATPAWPPTEGLAERFKDPDYALAFARIVTHYVVHDAFLEDEILLRNADRLAAVPGVLVNGRFDFQSPIGNAFELKRVWPQAELVVVDDAGHVPTGAIAREIVRAIDSFR